jgi:PKD repeat protein
VVKPAPSADFNYQVNSTGNFTFVASSPGLSYNWDFGDGNTGIGRSVTYKYTSNGNFDVTLSTTNGQGCSASSKRSVKVAGITGSVSNHVANFNVNVWPNPTNGFLLLELNASQCTASLVSIDGKLLNNWQLYNGLNTIDLNEVTQATGTYILKISNKESTQYFRILKQ